MEKLELNIVAKPKGNWVIPTTVQEIRSALANGICVETNWDGMWTAGSPYMPASDLKLQSWIVAGCVRFNMDMKVIFQRTGIYTMDGEMYMQNFIRYTASDLMEVEASPEFVKWISPRTYFIVENLVHV